MSTEWEKWAAKFAWTLDPSVQPGPSVERDEPVYREDIYTLVVDGELLYDVTPEQEARIRALTPEQRQRFLEILLPHETDY